MSFNELAEKRRSVRGFTSQNVSSEQIGKLLDAAVQSPSGGNCQPWHFYVITDKAVIGQIHEKAYKASWFLTAPLVIVVCVDSNRSSEKYGDRGHLLYSIQDTGAAIQSILLCAKDLGLDTCWCGAFDESAVSEILNIPENLRPITLIPTGYSNNNSLKPARRKMSEVVTFVGESGLTNECEEEAAKGIRFEHADMGGAVFDDINLGGAAFNNINLSEASFNNINMHKATFSDINMSETKYGGLCMNGAEFGCVDMQNAKFENPNLNGTTFNNCGLSELKITNCNLKNTEISCSDITGLKINGVEIQKLMNEK